MTAIDLAAFDLTVDHDARLVMRGDRQVKLTATQLKLLEWLDGCITPSLEFCCDELWNSVDPEWVRGQWDRLADAMIPLGVVPALDDDDMIGLHFCDAVGGLIARLVAPPTETSAAPAEAINGPMERIIITQTDQISELANEVERLTTQRDAERERANRLEAQLDAMDGEDAARIAELEAEVARLKLALDAKLAMVQRASEAMRAPDINGSVNAETRDAPVALAPRHVTIPVSEETYRWLEGVALRNRCSPEHVASRLMIAFRKSTRAKEAA